LIHDTQPKPNHGPSNLDYLGGIEYQEFEKLQDGKIIEAHLDYYKDFRWTSEQVVSKLELLRKENAKRYSLKDILEKAKERESGVIAYGD